MKLRRTAGAFAAIAATALLVTACGAPPAATPDPDPTTPGATDPADPDRPEQHITVGWNQPFFSHNNLTATGNATANANIIYMTTTGHQYYDGNLVLQPRPDFGTFNISDDGLVLEVSMTDGVVWSDGVPIDAADLILYWGAQNARHNTADQIEVPVTDGDGNPLFLDPDGEQTTEESAPGEIPVLDADGEPVLDDDGEPVTEPGDVPNTPITQWVTPEGQVWFSGTSTTINNMNTIVEIDDDGNPTFTPLPGAEFPTISDDGLSVTFTYSQFQNLWPYAFGTAPVAAHAIANLALGIDDPTEGKAAIIEAFRSNDTTALAAIANSWNNDFNFTSMPDNPLLFLSSGPFIIDEFVEGQYMILVRNPLFEQWADPAYVPTIDTVAIRWNEDPMAQIQAMANNELDLVAPQATVDTLLAVQGLANASYITAVGATWEHVDLVVGDDTFGLASPFNPVNWDGNEDAARLIRQAFLLSIPREQILQTLIDPIAPGSEVRNSFLWIPGSADYNTSVPQNGSDYFATADTALAAEKIAEARALAPNNNFPEGDIDVRMIFAPANVRRVDQFQLITGSAAQAGFNMVDASDPNWGTIVFADPDAYDAALFGWQSTNTALMNSSANYETGGQNNPYGWSSARIDELWAQVALMVDDTTPEAVAAGVEIEQIIWNEAWTIPIFQFPEIVAHSNNVANVSVIPLSPTIFWNFWEWEIVAD